MNCLAHALNAWHTDGGYIVLRKSAARIRTGGTDIITGLTVGTSGADVILNSVSITSGQTVTLNSAVITHAA